MKSVCSPYLALFTFVAILSQSAAFAIEPLTPGVTELEKEGCIPPAKELQQPQVTREHSPGTGGQEGCCLLPGRSLPVLDISMGGEVSVSDNNIVKRPWSSKSFEDKGKVQLVQYLAAVRGAVRQNKSFNETLVEKQFSSEQLHTTVIVHTADTMGFAKGFVAKRIAKNKLKHQSISFVIDDNGEGLQAWGMKHKSSAIIVLDASGRVLFAKDGPLTEIEIESTIKLIERQFS